MTPDQILWQSAQNLMNSQVNLDKLYDALDAVECEEADLVIECKEGDSDGDDWVTPIWSAYYAVRMRPNSNMKLVGWLTLTIQLTSKDCGGDNWESGRRAKVLVGFSPSSKDCGNRWSFDAESPDSSGKYSDCTVVGNRWISSIGSDRRWFFAVALDALTSTARVEQCIVRPLKRMLRGEKPDEVLSEIQEFLCKPPQQQ